MRITGETHLQTACYAAGLFAFSVWILWAGQVVLIPVAFAVISAFLLWQAVTAIGRVPLLRWMPIWLRHIAVLAIFMVGVFVLVMQIKANIDQLLVRLPTYQANIEGALLSLADRFGLDETPTWQTAAGFASDQFQPVPLVRRALAVFSDIGGQVALVILYATFLLVERLRFVRKIFLSFQDRSRAELTLEVLQDISDRIGAYLSAKTSVNIMLGATSYLVLRALGIDLAAFWAIAIGILNYIPYLGSLVAVAFPVLMALAQSGSLWLATLTAASLVALQLFFAFAVEPRLIGRKVNLSPFVVLLALSFWTVLWGFAGAVLAIPLTVMLADALAALPRTRPVAIMLSNDGGV